jgi:hypothetical protein
MTYPKKIALRCSHGYDPRLDALVDAFIRDGVRFIAVVGQDCERVEEIIDELVVGGASQDHDILTSSHPGETIEAAVAFARDLLSDLTGSVIQVVEL